MNLRNPLAFLLALLVSCGTVAAAKSRNWQTGKLLDAERARYYAGTIGSGDTTGTANTIGSSTTYHGTETSQQRAIYKVYETFVIDGGPMVYVAQEHLKWRWSKPANLTVNGPVKYVVEGKKLFVFDEDGKEHEMEIVKKTLKQSADKK